MYKKTIFFTIIFFSFIMGNVKAESIVESNYGQVPSDKTWTINFTDNLDSSTLNNENIYIENSSGDKIDVSIHTYPNSSKYFSVKAIDTLEVGETYNLIFTDGILNYKGVPLKESKMSFFIEDIEESAYFLGEWSTFYDGKNIIANFKELGQSHVILFQPITNVKDTNNTTSNSYIKLHDYGKYKVYNNLMNMNIASRSLNGQVNKISEDSFTITSRSGEIATFMRLNK